MTSHRVPGPAGLPSSHHGKKKHSSHSLWETITSWFAHPLVFSQNIYVDNYLDTYNLDSGGGFTWLVDLVLPNGAAADGNIIQEVVNELYHLSSKGEERLKKKSQYWEAWDVQEGKKRHDFAEDEDILEEHHKTLPYQPAEYKKHCDVFQGQTQVKCAGFYIVAGVAKFFTGDLPQDFSRNSGTEASFLPATREPPKGWTRKGGAHHMALSQWDCTGQDKSTHWARLDLLIVDERGRWTDQAVTGNEQHMHKDLQQRKDNPLLANVKKRFHH